MNEPTRKLVIVAEMPEAIANAMEYGTRSWSGWNSWMEDALADAFDRGGLKVLRNGLRVTDVRMGKAGEGKAKAQAMARLAELTEARAREKLAELAEAKDGRLPLDAQVIHGDFDYTENGGFCGLRRIDESREIATFPVRMTLDVDARPLQLARIRGKWCLAFDFEGCGDASFFAEIGDGRAMSFERAASLLSEVAPEAAGKEA